jgi:hypothetical protein
MKRGALPLSVVVIFVILAATAFFIAFGGTNPIWKSGETATDVVTQNFPGGVQQPTTGQQITQPSEELVRQYKALVDKLNSGAQGPCLLSYGKLDRLDEEGFKIQFLSGGSALGGKWSVSLVNKDGLGTHFDAVVNDVCVVGGEATESADFSDLFLRKEPAAQAAWNDAFIKLGIAPSQIVAENFYNNWIKDKVLKEGGKEYIHYHGQWFAPDYSRLSTLTITGAQSMEFVTADDKKYSTGKEDGGLLYVTEQGKVCVIATDGDVWPGCTSGYEKGLDQDCLDKKNKVDQLISKLGCKP